MSSNRFGAATEHGTPHATPRNMNTVEAMTPVAATARSAVMPHVSRRSVHRLEELARGRRARTVSGGAGHIWCTNGVKRAERHQVLPKCGDAREALRSATESTGGHARNFKTRGPKPRSGTIPLPTVEVTNARPKHCSSFCLHISTPPHP